MAPLASTPPSKVKTNIITEKQKQIAANRLIPRRFKSDTANITNKETGIIIKWRRAKKKVSKFLRCATAGLAANAKIAPQAEIDIIAAIIQRSIVHHHLPIILSSVRENVVFMMTRFPNLQQYCGKHLPVPQNL